MTILYFISVALFLCYIVILVFRFGIPKSISESSYLYGRKWNLIFWGWLTAVVFTMLIPWLEYTAGQSYQFMVFVSCAALCFTAITGRFRGDEGKMQANIHQYGTILCAVCAQLWMWFTFHNSWKLSVTLFPLAILLGISIKGKQVKSRKFGSENQYTEIEYGNIIKEKNSIVFWVEMALFIMAYSSILYFIKMK